MNDDPVLRRMMTAIVILWILGIATIIFALGMWVGSLT